MTFLAALVVAVVSAAPGGVTKKEPIRDVPGSGSLGLGLVLGEPSGIGARYWVTERVAAQLLLGGTFRHGGVATVADVVYALPGIASRSVARFDLSFGVGLELARAQHEVTSGDPDGHHCHDEPRPYCHSQSGVRVALFGLRGLAGASMVLTKLPLELYIELGPIVRMTPSVGLELLGGLGARYYIL